MAQSPESFVFSAGLFPTGREVLHWVSGSCKVAHGVTSLVCGGVATAKQTKEEQAYDRGRGTSREEPCFQRKKSQLHPAQGMGRGGASDPQVFNPQVYLSFEQIFLCISCL